MPKSHLSLHRDLDNTIREIKGTRVRQRISRSEYFYRRVPAWLTTAIFCQHRIRVAAAESNLRRALRSDEGRDAALITVGEFPNLTHALLPRVWAVRQALLSKVRS